MPAAKLTRALLFGVCLLLPLGLAGCGGGVDDGEKVQTDQEALDDLNAVNEQMGAEYDGT